MAARGCGILMVMKHHHHVHHASHVFSISYPASLAQRLYSFILGPLIIFTIAFVIVELFPVFVPASADVSLNGIALATFFTCLRLVVAYILAVIVAVPLALVVTANSKLESVLLPLFDILESVPILALFPVIIMLFVRFDFLNGAAIFILFLSMLWNLVFTLVGGLKLIPKDIYYAAQVFGLRGLTLLRRVVLPALVPQFVTGSILAVAQGWNLIIVAEVLHTYIPGGTSAQDLYGVGSILVNAAAHAENETFLASVFAMVVVIAFLNLFVWQHLLKYAQRFRFE